MTTYDLLRLAVLLAGWGTMALVVVSPLIPVILKWNEDTSKLRPLTRQIFWTYAVYIWVTNFWFALLSMFMADALLNKSGLAAALTAYMALFCTGRVWVHFFSLDKTDAPSGLFNKLAEYALTTLSILLMVTYIMALVWNLGWGG